MPWPGAPKTDRTRRDGSTFGDMTEPPAGRLLTPAFVALTLSAAALTAWPAAVRGQVSAPSRRPGAQYRGDFAAPKLDRVRVVAPQVAGDLHLAATHRAQLALGGVHQRAAEAASPGGLVHGERRDAADGLRAVEDGGAVEGDDAGERRAVVHHQGDVPLALEGGPAVADVGGGGGVAEGGEEAGELRGVEAEGITPVEFVTRVRTLRGGSFVGAVRLVAIGVLHMAPDSAGPPVPRPPPRCEVPRL